VGPGSPQELRASDADREAAVARLRIAAMEGRLDAEELADRVTTALEAKWCRDLERLTADVTPAAQARAPAPRPVGAPVFVRPAQTTNVLAITSLVLGLIWFAWFGSVGAVICGHIALRQIRESGGRQTGRGLAIGGLALGYFWLLMLTLTLVRAIGG
jgi:hypothetical protein